jgi:hypothetical protein
MSLEHYFTTPFTVFRETPADGSWGSQAQRSEVCSSKGWIQPGSGRPLELDGKEVAVTTHHLLCPVDADVRALDEIEAEGKRYNVLSAFDAAGMGHHLEVDLELKA